jgi:hypothetical protein
MQLIVEPSKLLEADKKRDIEQDLTGDYHWDAITRRKLVLVHCVGVCCTCSACH